jgi:glycosyltransferase involved in cell wall biosynthesis
MHVVMLSDLETTGGAAIAANRLAEGLTIKGITISRITGISDATVTPPSWEWHLVFPNLSGGYIPKIIERASIPSLTRIYTAISARRIDSLLRRLKPDIINVHNIHGAGWSPEIITSCLTHAPVVWTLHDMWSFTGRCAYSYDCRKFLIGCDHSCPTADEYPHTSRRNICESWKVRQKLFDETRENLVAVTPSRWLAVEARKGLWNSHRIEVIPNGLPLDLYHPQARATARTELGIDGDGPFLLAAAQYLFERRKGGHLFLEAVKSLDDEVSIITFGMNKLEISDKRNKIFNLGFVSEKNKILALNAADFYVHPAPVDNLPNVVMEAIACGTPVVGFNIGGVTEMIRESLTGWIASDVSIESLTDAMKKALEDVSHGSGMRDSCRTIAEKEYDVNLMAERYLKLFRSLKATT